MVRDGISRDMSLSFRQDATIADVQAVRQIVMSSGFFSDSEIDVATDMVKEHLSMGSHGSGYHYVFADIDGSAAAFVCYGPIECTSGSFDLYWIAVHEHHRRNGMGQHLMIEAERLIAQEGGERVYVETSARPQYEPTRKFYLACGYSVAAVLDDFYAPRDGKIILVKVL